MSIDADMFVNLPKHKAQDLAEKFNMIFRLVSVDGEIFLGYPPADEEPRTDRVCIELKKGIVAQAVIQ